MRHELPRSVQNAAVRRPPIPMLHHDSPGRQEKIAQELASNITTHRSIMNSGISNIRLVESHWRILPEHALPEIARASVC